MTAVPDPVARVADLMSSFGASWSLCGGWAVDAWLGRQTRAHGDIDISVFEDDQRAIFEHLVGWQLIAHDDQVPGDTTEPWKGRRIERPAHIHASPDPETVSAWVAQPGAQLDGFKLEIVLDERAGRDWVFRPEPRIALPLRRSIQQSGWGLPTAAPEALLFYKATAYFGVEGMKERPQDESDFLALLPKVTGNERAWLSEAISLATPGHPWLTHLSF